MIMISALSAFAFAVPPLLSFDNAEPLTWWMTSGSLALGLALIGLFVDARRSRAVAIVGLALSTLALATAALHEYGKPLGDRRMYGHASVLSKYGDWGHDQFVDVGIIAIASVIAIAAVLISRQRPSPLVHLSLGPWSPGVLASLMFALTAFGLVASSVAQYGLSADQEPAHWFTTRWYWLAVACSAVMGVVVSTIEIAMRRRQGARLGLQLIASLLVSAAVSGYVLLVTIVSQAWRWQ